MTSVWVPDHAGHAVIVVTSWVAGGWGQKGIGVGKVGLLVASAACSIVVMSYAVVALTVERVAAPGLSLVGGGGCTALWLAVALDHHCPLLWLMWGSDHSPFDLHWSPLGRRLVRRC